MSTHCLRQRENCIIEWKAHLIPKILLISLQQKFPVQIIVVDITFQQDQTHITKYSEKQWSNSLICHIPVSVLGQYASLLNTVSVNSNTQAKFNKYFKVHHKLLPNSGEIWQKYKVAWFSSHLPRTTVSLKSFKLKFAPSLFNHLFQVTLKKKDVFLLQLITINDQFLYV